MNRYGRIAQHEWLRTPKVRPEVELDSFVVMPNHIHGIVLISESSYQETPQGAHSRAPLQRKPRSLGALIAGFKSIVTKRINALRRTPAVQVWQRNYFEHVVRNEEEMARIREYVIDNPRRWAEDDNNPANIGTPLLEPVGAHGRAPIPLDRNRKGTP